MPKGDSAEPSPRAKVAALACSLQAGNSGDGEAEGVGPGSTLFESWSLPPRKGTRRLLLWPPQAKRAWITMRAYTTRVAMRQSPLDPPPGGRHLALSATPAGSLNAACNRPS